jgi:hypothetical protein
VTEAELQAEVIALAGRLGLVVLHVRQPQREDSRWWGFPDLVIFAPGGGVAFRELKAPGKRPSADQRDWAEILSGQDYGIWKPHDWMAGRVQAELHALAGEGYRPPGPVTAEQRMWAALRKDAERGA